MAVQWLWRKEAQVYKHCPVGRKFCDIGTAICWNNIFIRLKHQDRGELEHKFVGSVEPMPNKTLQK